MADDPRPARPEDDPEYRAELDRLRSAHSEGKIGNYDYNAGRRAALAAARARLAGAAAGKAEATAGAPIAAGAPDGPAAVSPPAAPVRSAEPLTFAAAAAAAAATPATAPGASPERRRPSGWTEDKSGPKYWSADGRGDDPTVRVVHPPLGPGVGSGKAFLFLFGLKKSREIDRKMIARELAEIDDDIAALREAGFTVVVDPQGSKQDFLQAIYGEGEGVENLVPAGIYWSAHGHEDGSIECCDASTVRPADVETARVSPGLKLVVFGACYTGSWARTWRAALGNHPLVVGWGRPVTIERAVEFLRSDPETDTDLDDLIARYLLQDTPVPPLTDAKAPEAASKHGRKREVRERIERVAGILAAKWREEQDYCELWVPLPDRRHHVVRLFVTHATQEYSEGKALVGAEAEVGELTPVVQVEALLRGTAEPGYARVALVRGRADLPDIVVQGFIPLRHATDLEIASLAYQVASTGDQLERDIFGGDRQA